MKNLSLILFFVMFTQFLNEAQAISLRAKIGKALTERGKVKNPEELLPKGGKLIQDLAYGSAKLQMMDVYLPAGKPQPQVFFMVHGGGWAIGDRKEKRFLENKVRRWVPKGFIVIACGYRLIPDANPLEQANDVAQALNFAQKKAPEWGADSLQFVLLGHSAGAHLVSLISTAISNPKYAVSAESGAKLFLPFKPMLATISLDSALMNAPELMKQKHAKLYDEALGDDPKFWEAISPWHQLMGKVSPFYMVCSTEREDSCPQGEALEKKLQSFGGQAELNKVDMSHRQVNEQAGIHGEYTDKIESFLKKLGLKL
jgi:acetyl esterase/lipase